jgi:hypothetical protein
MVPGLGDQALFSQTSSGRDISSRALKGKARIALFYGGPGIGWHY